MAYTQLELDEVEARALHRWTEASTDTLRLVAEVRQLAAQVEQLQEDDEQLDQVRLEDGQDLEIVRPLAIVRG